MQIPATVLTALAGIVVTTCSTTTTSPLVHRTCGYLLGGLVQQPSDNQEEKEPLCTQEEWDEFVKEMGLEKEEPMRYYDVNNTSDYSLTASNSITVSG